MQPGDTFLAMDLASGGHLTHGAKPNVSGKWFNAVHYGVRKDTEQIDYEEVRELAKKHKPKLIIAGGSAIPRQIDFSKFRNIADEINAFLMVDMAHFSGLVAGGQHPNPLDFADVATSTTHKTLRGPRGGIILTNSEEYAKKFNSAVFPGLQGGPLMHVIAAKAVAFEEALKPDFKAYQSEVIRNAQALAKRLEERGFRIVTGGTDTHVILVDVGSKKIKGNEAERSLGNANITCNKNSIPFDLEKPMVTSGIRLGTPAGTTRGFGVQEFLQVGDWIADTLESLQSKGPSNNLEFERSIKQKVIELCKNFPIY
jgi:glycine hydroxymethyltransferase